MGFTGDYLERCWKRRAVWRGKKAFPGDWYLAGDPLELRLVGEAETTSMDFQSDEVAFVPDADDLLELIDNRLKTAGADPAEKSITVAYDPDKLWSIDIRYGDGSRYNARNQESIHSGLLYALQVMAQSGC
jgi:hypothetical protein